MIDPTTLGLVEHPHSLDVELPAHVGVRVRLRDAMGRDGLMLVFYRGHWCPYCRRYLAKLQGNLARFAERGVSIIAISPEPSATGRRLADQLQLTFPLLSDRDGMVIDAFGVRNGLRPPAAAPRGALVLPHPAVLLLDATGAVRFKRVDRNFKRRTTMHTLLTEAARLHAGPVAT